MTTGQNKELEDTKEGCEFRGQEDSRNKGQEDKSIRVLYTKGPDIRKTGGPRG